jgi:hypothetical protein
VSTLIVSAIFAVSIPLSIAHSDAAKYFWILIVPVNLVARFVAVRRWKRAHPGEPYPRDRHR